MKNDTREYQIGFRFLDLAHDARQRVDIYDLVVQEVDKLADGAARWPSTLVKSTEWASVSTALGEHSVQTPLYIVYWSELHYTAVGKTILAHMPRDRVEEIIEVRGLPKLTEATISDPETLFS